jgi:elongation factor Ts
VAGNESFRKLAADLAQQLAEGPGAATPEELLKQPSPGRKGMTLQGQFDELTNQIREVFRLPRILRVNAPCGGYAHHDGSKGVLIEVSGGTNEELVKEFGMQIVAMRPDVVAIEDLDPAVVAKEKEILKEAARKEGKPDNIIDKMVEGRLRNFYAERVLNEQPFVKDDKTTVGKLAKSAGMKIVRFHYWVLGGK